MREMIICSNELILLLFKPKLMWYILPFLEILCTFKLLLSLFLVLKVCSVRQPYEED
jgi:hypothetical protein